MRARELAPGASSSIYEVVERSTIDGSTIVVDTTEGVPTNDDVAGSKKPGPPTC